MIDIKDICNEYEIIPSDDENVFLLENGEMILKTDNIHGAKVFINRSFNSEEFSNYLQDSYFWNFLSNEFSAYRNSDGFVDEICVYSTKGLMQFLEICNHYKNHVSLRETGDNIGLKIELERHVKKMLLIKKIQKK